jgi:hypothetical protein
MDLSEKINMLYNFFYSKTGNQNYKINNIELEKINLDDIKFKYIDSESYNSILTETFLGKFKLLCYNDNNLSTVLKKYSDDLSVYISITPYKNKKAINSLEDKNNLDSLFSYILSELVINKKTRHIMLPIINIDAEFQQISDVLKNYDSFSDYNTGIQNNDISNIFSINIKENFFKGIYLNQYLENHECNLKNLLFQVIHTLAVIQKNYKGFRHNKLNHKNIYSYIKKDNKEIINYSFKNKNYYLNDSILDIKFTNFNESSLPGYFSSKSNIPFYNKDNDYFDLHYFLNSMYQDGYLESNCKETNKFLEKVLPEKYRNKTNNYYLEENVELFKPVDLLEDDYFSSYKTEKKEDFQNMSENNYYMGKNVYTRKIKNNVESDDSKLNRILLESENSDIEQNGGGTLTNLPVKPERNNPFLSNDKRNVFKSRKESESDGDSDHNSRKNKKKFNRIGKSKFPNNSPFNPKGYNNSNSNKNKKKPEFKNDKGNKFFKKEEKSFHKEEKIAERTESNSDNSSFNYGPFDTNQRKKNTKIREDEKPPTPKPKSPEIVAEQIVYKNPSFKPVRKFKEKDWWDPEKNKTEESKRKPFDVPQGKIHSPGPNTSNQYESDSEQYSTDSGSESNTDYTEERPRSNFKPNYNKPNYDKPRYNNDKPRYNNDKPHYDKPHYDKPHYDKPNYNKPHYDKPNYNKPHYDKPRYNNDKPHYERKHHHSDNESQGYKPKYHKDVTQTPLLAEQRVYEPAPKKGSDHRHPKYNHPGFINLEDDEQFPPGFVWDYKSMPWPRSMPLKKPNEIPLQKVYNINLGNASNKHTTLNTLYEDIIPGDPYTYSMVKISERQHLLRFIKNIVLQNNDTEFVTLQSDPAIKSIQSFFRILAFNPYNNNNQNPYLDLPINFLLYNLAYPVRYNEGTVNIAKNSMGLNLRIYSLSKGALVYNNTGLRTRPQPPQQPRDITWKDYDVWREIFYYEYIRDIIMKRNISPNFITLFFYAKDPLSRIDYNQLNQIIQGHTNNNYINLQIRNQAAITNAFSPNINNTDLETLFNTQTFPNDFTAHSDHSLLTVTEAPTSSFYAWALPSYDRFGAQFKMVSTGHHSDNIWISVLFQLLYSLCVMKKHNINIRSFSVANNIFIKDLFSNINSINYWLYKVDDYEFYVPNYGYLLLVDSRFLDIVNYPTINGNYDNHLQLINGDEQKFKMPFIGNNDPNWYAGDTTQLDNFNIIFKNVINELLTEQVLTNAYSNEIGNKLNAINNDLIANMELKNILGKHFGELLHNRIGTSILKSEKDNLPFGVTSDITPGKLIVYQKRYDEYYWGVIVGNEDANGKVDIMTRDATNRPLVSNEFVSNILHYPSNLSVEQNKVNNLKLTPDGLLETYSLE